MTNQTQVKPDWIDRHSVNCFKCGVLFDDREGITNPNNDEGGTLCPNCIKNEPTLNLPEVIHKKDAYCAGPNCDCGYKTKLTDDYGNDLLDFEGKVQYVEMSQNHMIEALIIDDIDSILSGDCTSYLADILRDGFKGYRKYTNEEIKREYQERLGDK